MLMKNVRNISIACAFVASIGQVTYADDSPNSSAKRGYFVYGVYAPTAKGGNIEGYQFDDTNYLGLGVGYTNKKLRSLGYYIDMKFTPDIVNDSGDSDLTYRYLMMNAGVTFNVIDNLALLGGIGVSLQDGSFMRYGDHYSTKEKNTEFNLNFGAMYKITQSFGVVGGYDTSSSAYSVGIAFGW